MTTPSPEALAAAKELYPKTAVALADVEAAEAAGMNCPLSQSREMLTRAANIIDKHFAAMRADLEGHRARDREWFP